MVLGSVFGGVFGFWVVLRWFQGVFEVFARFFGWF